MPYATRYTRTYPGASVTPPASGFEDVYPWIARCLQDTAKDVDDGYFDLDIRSELRDRLPDDITFASLSGKDRDRVAEAIGHLVAAKNRGPLATGGAGFELSSEKTETTSRGFSGGVALDASWIARAKELLALCSFAPPDPTGTGGIPVLSFFAANGPSRERMNRSGRR